MSQRCWVGFELPFRPCSGTYEVYTDPLPSIDTSQYQSIKNLQDLRSRLDSIDFESATACYFDINESTGVFYRDQQDCIIWKLIDGQVVAYESDGETRIGVVADSLPEFLARLRIENHIWFSTYTTASESPKGTWSRLQSK
jgi:hypothetical protein